MVFVKKNIRSKLTSKLILIRKEIFVELKKKWLLSCPCNPNNGTITHHLQISRKNLDLYSVQHENIIIQRDFNTDINHSCMK